MKEDKVLKTINSWVKEFHSGRKKFNHKIPCYLNYLYLPSCTIITQKSEVYQLNPNLAGFMKEIKVNFDTKKECVVTNLMGYSFCSTCVENKEKDSFLFLYCMMLNGMITSAVSNIGDLYDKEIHLGHINDEYFLDTEEYAGYEFRIYVRNKDKT